MMQNSGKSVIFVGGTAYSGSTFLDMMLANHPQGFSCGEVHAFFRPFRPHHYDPPCGCEDPGCTLWNEIRRDGEKRLYQSIFERNPHVRFIVDSSKSLPWITRHTRGLKMAGIDVRHILIWKSPAHIARSFGKRGRGRRWIRSWVNYHRLYFRLIDRFRAVNHQALAEDPALLEGVCNWLGIGYASGQHEYWNKRHHTLFGNTSARIHTRELDSGTFTEDAEALVRRSGASNSDLRRNFRTIHVPRDDSGTDVLLGETDRARQEVAGIEEYLRRCGVGAQNSETEDPPAAGTLEVLAHAARWKASAIGLSLLPRRVVQLLWPQQNRR